jgi:hypothetical protein
MFLIKGKKMYEVKIKGFKTKKQAQEFINWYSGQGEQDASVWFEARKAEGKLDVSFMPIDYTNRPDWNGNTYEAEVKLHP